MNYLNEHVPLFAPAEYKPFSIFKMTQDSFALKEEGNNLFKSGDVQGALSCYTKALQLSGSEPESSVLYRNRCACYLKLNDYNKAIADASKGTEPY